MTGAPRKSKQGDTKTVPDMPFDDALKRMLNTPPKPKAKAPAKKEKQPK
jgi:hypothetical protein